jgi:hypothetical protein
VAAGVERLADDAMLEDLGQGASNMRRTFDLPSADECHARLTAAGWSVGHVGVGAAPDVRWLVTGTNGENRVAGRGGTLAEAYWRACRQAKAAGMLGRANRP